MLVPQVTVVIHPIDTQAHPSWGPGWRWAVMVGGVPPADLDHCAQAGRQSTEMAASVDGEHVGAACAQALRMLGIPAAYRVLRLDHDPIPAHAERVNTLVE